MQDGKITARGTPRSQQDRGKVTVTSERLAYSLRCVVDKCRNETHLAHHRLPYSARWQAALRRLQSP